MVQKRFLNHAKIFGLFYRILHEERLNTFDENLFHFVSFVAFEVRFSEEVF
jgi:hypothetical protein